MRELNSEDTPDETGINTLRLSDVLAPIRYPSTTFSGLTSGFVWPFKYKRSLVVPTPTVVAISTDVNSTVFSVVGNSFGGIICVIYPTSSCEYAFFLNPAETNAFAPKLEFELVTDISPPVSAEKCSA